MTIHVKSRPVRTMGAIRDQKYNAMQHQLDTIFTQTEAMLLVKLSKLAFCGLEKDKNENYICNGYLIHFQDKKSTHHSNLKQIVQ